MTCPCKDPSSKDPLCVLVIVAVGLSALTLGCQRPEGPERFPVRGSVTLDGKPVPSGTVFMQPQENGLPAATAIVKEGRFEFAQSDGPGAGAYQIRFEPAYPEFEEFAVNPASLPSPKKPTIAPQFTQFGTLTTVVSATGLNPDVFELKSR